MPVVSILLAIFSILAILLILLLAILFLPWDIHVRLDSDWAAPGWDEPMTGAVRWRFRFRWGWASVVGVWAGEFFALNRSEVRIFGIRPRSRPERRKVRPAKPKRKRKRQRPDLPLLMAIVQESVRLLQRSVRDLGFRIAGEVTYGFPEPDVTGWCEALRWSLDLPVPIRLEPDFNRSVLTGWAEVNGRTSLYRLIAAAWRALDNPVIRGRLADKLRFKPIRAWLLRGGKHA